MDKDDKTNDQADEQPHAEEERTSNLIKHAEREIDIAGLKDSDADYGGKIAEAVLELIHTFSDQGHSGGSAAITLNIFMQLASWEILTPPTDDPDEWESVSKEMGTPMWQNKRGSSYFSTDGGKTWKHLKTGNSGRSTHVTKPDIIKKPDQ